MRNKLCTMIAVCGLAVAAMSPAALACDKEKVASKRDSAGQVQSVLVADVTSTCSKSRQAKAVQVADGKSICSKSRQRAGPTRYIVFLGKPKDLDHVRQVVGHRLVDEQRFSGRDDNLGLR